MMLEMQKYSVEVVHDNCGCIFYAESTPYDLILLDVMMPEIWSGSGAWGEYHLFLMLTAKAN